VDNFPYPSSDGLKVHAATGWHRRHCRLGLRLLGDHRLGGDQETRDRRGVLQRVAHHLGRVDKPWNRHDVDGALALMTAAVSVPVSIDLEAGYGDTPDAAAESVTEILKAGAIGINIEDGLFEGLSAGLMRTHKTPSESTDSPTRAPDQGSKFDRC
jgi:hypothetical protein